MRLNSKSELSGVRVDKFLNFYLNERGIETNPNKFEVVIRMNSLISKKEVQKLIGMLIALNILISKYVHHTLPFYRLLRNKTNFKWTTEFKNAFESLKKTLATPCYSQDHFWREL